MIASNGAVALTLAAERPDPVLLDVNSPDTNGFGVCRQLKMRTETQFVKVLQTSAAHNGSLDRVKSMDVGLVRLVDQLPPAVVVMDILMTK